MDEAPPYDFSKDQEENLRRRIQILGVLYLLFAGILLPLVLLGVSSAAAYGSWPAGILATVLAGVGIGLWRFSPMARYAAYVLAVPLLLAFPMGTFLSVYSVFVLTKGRKFFGRKVAECA